MTALVLRAISRYNGDEEHLMKQYPFTVVCERDEDGRVLAICPALQGCYTEGETEEEARANIRAAIHAHIQSRLVQGECTCSKGIQP